LQEEQFMDAEDEVQDEWSANELPEKVREEVYAKIPRAVRRGVRKAHVGLGHPSRGTFLRMMRLGGASPGAMEYAKAWQCPVCTASAPPTRPLQASTRTRPFGFNKAIAMDLKYLKDGAHQNHVALSVVDGGTSWHAACLLKNRRPEHVVKKLLALWFAPYGVPEIVIVDQGGEFEGAFIAMCEEYAIDTRAVGAHAPWQHGFAERHGGILGTIWTKMVRQFGIEGRSAAKMLLSVCVQAKNSTLTRNGMTPEQAVFGRALRWPTVGTTDDDEIPMAALGTDGEAWLAAQIRAAARMALLSRDASDKLRRATLRRAPGVVEELTPGTRIYFWSPHPGKGRMRTDPLRWRGPATVIAKESPGRYYVGWRSRVLLVSKDQIRLATMEEAAASDKIAKDMALTADQKFFQDVSAGVIPPKRRRHDEEAPTLMPALRDMPEAVGALEPTVEEEQEQERIQQLEDLVVADMEANPEVEVVEEPVEVNQPLALMDTTEVHKRLLDDVPQSMKRYKVGAEKLATVVMFVKDGVQDSWLDADNLRGLGSLIGFHVTGARVHRETRARLFEHDRHRQLRRLTLMCTAADVIDIRDDGPGRTRTRQKHPAWTGMTIFYEQRPKYGIRDEIKYIDTPMGLIQMLLSKEEADDVADIFSTWNFPASVYALQMKPSGKELDPKMFDKQEKRAFNEADAAEWKSWLANGSVRVVPLGKESSIPRDQVFSAPMRFVRTNKSKDPEKLQAKSRLIIPGHRDPQLGLYRTDSPTTSGLAVMVVATIAAARGWFMKFFDVSTAFLSGKEIGRTVFIRAPPEGLPSVHGQRAVQPYQLLQVLKGAYGLTEAPRLWYLRARELLLEIGFVELCCARAVFILREQEETIAMLTLHVDDGLLAGDRSHKKYQKVYKGHQREVQHPRVA
jgi:hypothetical protein